MALGQGAAARQAGQHPRRTAGFRTDERGKRPDSVLVVWGKQNNEYALDRGADNRSLPGRRTGARGSAETLVDGGVDFVIIGGWSAILHGSSHTLIQAFDRSVWTLDLPSLLRAKRAAGRVKNLRVLPELEGLLDAQQPE